MAQYQAINEVENGLDVNLYWGRYLPLYKAALEGDWERAKSYFELHPSSLSAPIMQNLGTVLHVAARTEHSIRFLGELVSLMPKEMLTLKDKHGDTALFNAASAGNIKAAATMVRKNGDLPQIRNNYGQTPIEVAATYGNRDVVWYLCSVTRDEDPSPFRGQDGFKLLNLVIIADLYDVALHLLQLFPHLVFFVEESGDNALHKLARKPLAFRSGSRLGFWQRCIYSCVRVKVADAVAGPNHAYLCNQLPAQFLRATHITQVLQCLNGLFQNTMDQIGIWHLSYPFDILRNLNLCVFVVDIPLCSAFVAMGIQRIRDTKLMHIQSVELVKFICAQVVTVGNREKITNLLGFPLLTAAKYGIVEIIIECVESYPDLIWSRQANMQNVFHIAVANRQEKVFNLLSEMSAHKKSLVSFLDSSGNSILHSAGRLAPSQKLNSISGAALQLQSELKWFKEVETVVQPAHKELMNLEGKAARDLFTEEHKVLVEKGERWMKDTSTSYMVVASLISTVMFAATFTVPGGNNVNNGIPMFLKENSFIVFAISDAVSLFSSASSILIFLSILTSRYAEEDFHMLLPKRMIIGLTTLFFSILSMMIAVSASLSIMLRHQLTWVVIPVALFACLPVILFALLQFPLFIELIFSTYGFNIVKRQRGPMIY